MARLLLLADSNFQNNIGVFKNPKICDLEIKSCQSRKAVANELSGIDEGIVVISCLDTIAAEIAKNSVNEVDSTVELYLNQLLFKVVDKIDETNGKLAIGIMAPLFWASHPIMVKKALNHFYKSARQSPAELVWISDPLRDVYAGSDGTHLTATSARIYIQHIFDHFKLIDQATKFDIVRFEPVTVSQTGTSWADDVPLGQDPEAVTALGPPDDAMVISPARTTSAVSTSMLSASFSQQRIRPQVSFPAHQPSMAERLINLAHHSQFNTDMTVPPPTVSAQLSNGDPWRTADVVSSLARIERRVGSIESKMFFDNVMMAGLKEEQDSEANKAMLSRIVFNGVVIPGLQSATEEEQIPLIKAKIDAIINAVKQEGKEYKVLFVRHLNKNRRGQLKAVIEVKLEDAKQATGLRSDYVKKQKETDSPIDQKMGVAPVVRLATRVRIEILFAVAKLLPRHDLTIVRAMVLQFISKPVIKVVRKSAAGVEFVRTMTFIEAVCWVKENNLGNSINLSSVYDRAGASFRGTLPQTFVLLSATNA